MALPPKKKQSSGTVDNQNTGGPVKAKPATPGQVKGAIKAFAKKKKDMDPKTAKRVAKRLKGMRNGQK